MKRVFRLPLLMLLGLLALLVFSPAHATSCAGQRSFLASLDARRDEPGTRVVRARVVPFDIGLPGYKPPAGAFMFEVREFIGGQPGEKPGARFSGTGVSYFMLNVTPEGRQEPFPEGTEWILLAGGSEEQLVALACGAILEVRADTVHGFIRGRSLDRSQAMPLADLRRAVRERKAGGRK